MALSTRAARVGPVPTGQTQDVVPRPRPRSHDLPHIVNKRLRTTIGASRTVHRNLYVDRLRCCRRSGALARAGEPAHIRRMRDMPIADVVLPPVPRAYRGVNWDGPAGPLHPRGAALLEGGDADPGRADRHRAALHDGVRGRGRRRRAHVEGVPFGAFIAPGLIMMQILNNAFSNSSSSLLQAKMNGLIGDFLTPPLSPGELVAGFALGAADARRPGRARWRRWRSGRSRASASPTSGRSSTSAVGAALIMGLLGAMAAIWSEKFDHIAAVTNFIVMPMTFLSGTFYLVEEPARAVPHHLALQPVLLPDRRLPLRLHRPHGRLAGDRRRADRRAGRVPVVGRAGGCS